MKRFWSQDEIDYIKKNYSDLSSHIIAKQLGMTISQIYNQAYRLGLYKSPEYIKNNCRTIEPNKRTQFGKGHNPWNKGMKGLQIGGKQTQFKKGQIPYNTKPIGHRSFRDGYLVEKTEKGFEFVHILLWKKHYGQIPKGLFVVFKDRNKSNITIENLELIDRVENMKRNSYLNLPEEIQEVINVKKAISKVITEKIKNYGKK